MCDVMFLEWIIFLKIIYGMFIVCNILLGVVIRLDVLDFFGVYYGLVREFIV